MTSTTLRRTEWLSRIRARTRTAAAWNLSTRFGTIRLCRSGWQSSVSWDMPEYPYMWTDAMTQIIVGKWGKSLAIRVPLDIARSAGLSDGEEVEIEELGGDILIRRSAAHARNRKDAEAAAAEIIADGRNYTLGGVSILDLRDDGRRG